MRSDVAVDACSSSPLSPLSDDMLKALTLSVKDEESAQVAAQIDLVLEMTATFDADGFQEPSKVTRKEVQRALQSCDGDVSRAVDEVLSLVAIKALSQQDQQTLKDRHERQQEHTKLQLGELCSGLGLDEDSSFVIALQQLPQSERDDLLATDGAFVQQLLLSLDEEDGSEDGSETEDIHPLQYLLEMYPDYKVEVVEDVLDSHNYDVDKAAEALYNLRALNHVQSYATVVNADARAAAQQREVYVNGPKVDSMGQFPELAYPALPRQGNTAKMKTKGNFNAWDHQHAPHDRMESGITTQLKLERLKKLLPSIDASVIQTTFFLNGCSSDATEAALREVHNLPLAQKLLPPPSATEEVEMAAAAAAAEEELAAAKNTRPSRRETGWNLVSSKNKVVAARKTLSNRYCDLLASFRRGQHVLAADRVRELSKARRDHREAQRQCAHDFFLAHQEHLKHQRPIDLHGFIVMEALWVAREAIQYCQEHRIRRCLLICGVGHHSINGKPRILTALQLSLERRGIASRELNGVVTVFPLRSTDST
eukprot:jgi/Phyca11/524955/estExt2_fgenesh1_pm.C_PHYCAscaffold_10175